MKKHQSTIWFLALVASSLVWSSHHFWATGSVYWTMVRFTAFFPLTVFAFAFLIGLFTIWNLKREARNYNRSLQMIRKERKYK